VIGRNLRCAVELQADAVVPIWTRRNASEPRASQSCGFTISANQPVSWVIALDLADDRRSPQACTRRRIGRAGRFPRAATTEVEARRRQGLHAHALPRGGVQSPADRL
jgi:hypothetical protein